MQKVITNDAKNPSVSTNRWHCSFKKFYEIEFSMPSKKIETFFLWKEGESIIEDVKVQYDSISKVVIIYYLDVPNVPKRLWNIHFRREKNAREAHFVWWIGNNTQTIVIESLFSSLILFKPKRKTTSISVKIQTIRRVLKDYTKTIFSRKTLVVAIIWDRKVYEDDMSHTLPRTKVLHSGPRKNNMRKKITNEKNVILM